jgi:predicted nucleic-acid-binding Zn-ribbon protein
MQGQCPQCANNTYVTRRITLPWGRVLVALSFSLIVFCILYLIFPAIAHSRGGRLPGYLVFGAIGLVGWLFTYFVKKDTYLVERCTRCDFKQSKKIVETDL